VVVGLLKILLPFKGISWLPYYHIVVDGFVPHALELISPVQSADARLQGLE
jgi:hypothetical protein